MNLFCPQEARVAYRMREVMIRKWAESELAKGFVRQVIQSHCMFHILAN